jgi:hypothetical protein
MRIGMGVVMLDIGWEGAALDGARPWSGAGAEGGNG